MEWMKLFGILNVIKDKDAKTNINLTLEEGGYIKDVSRTLSLCNLTVVLTVSCLQYWIRSVQNWCQNDSHSPGQVSSLA